MLADICRTDLVKGAGDMTELVDNGSQFFKKLFKDVDWMMTWRVAVFLMLVWIGWSAAKLASAVDTNAENIAVKEVLWPELDSQ